MSELKDYVNCGDEILRGIVEVLNLALIDKFPHTRIDHDELDHMTAALRLLCEAVPELDMIAGRMLIVRGDWIAATQVFRELAEKGQCLPNSRAMQIYCMSENNDADWRVEAHRMLEDETSPDAIRLIRTVVARNDLNRALEASKMTGEFAFPDSLKQLVAERQQREATEAAEAQPVPTAMDPSLMMGHQYMRL
ncbi:HrpB1 family type III secretion system apparatus protein [Trinickia acidisoli]|uniref:HrpB1 family type III secretion system apparatus protein n=1 Tax=Trinickia acidisoli TaxID=2767482 RepID=UPI001A90078C|nr:HrpB1 family type III secretion system apparatus protein [Trinickia acidisoli]